MSNPGSQLLRILESRVLWNIGANSEEGTEDWKKLHNNFFPRISEDAAGSTETKLDTLKMESARSSGTFRHICYPA